MLRSRTINCGIGEQQLWCCKCDDVTQTYNATIRSAHNDVPNSLWYGSRRGTWEFRTFGYKTDAIINTQLKYLGKRTEPGLYIGITSTNAVIRHWIPYNIAQHQVYLTIKQSYQTAHYLLVLLSHTSNLLQNNHIQQRLIQYIIHYLDQIQLYWQLNCLLKYILIGLTVKECGYHSAPHIQSSSYGSILQN